MPSEKKAFDFWYAVHNTQIVRAPSRALETFGETRIHYYHLAELPDVPGKVRVREGRLEAHKPLLITPEAYVQEEMSGFGEQARQYLDFLKQHQDAIPITMHSPTALPTLASCPSIAPLMSISGWQRPSTVLGVLPWLSL